MKKPCAEKFAVSGGGEGWVVAEGRNGRGKCLPHKNCRPSAPLS